MTYPIWFDLTVALAIGLLIGLERERSKGEGPSRRPAGIRTFALTSLAGAVAYHIGEVTLLATIVGTIALLAAVSYARNVTEDPGLTTDVGLILASLLGGLSIIDPIVAAGIGVTVAVLFAAKDPLHLFVTDALTHTELRDGLFLGIATLVIWPQLPNQYLGPFQSINPHSLWFLAVLVLLIGAGGHIATRLLGARYGLPLSGFASGFISSTATIGTMAGVASVRPEALKSAIAGAVLSTAATFIQMSLLLFIISKSTLYVLLPALIAGGLVAILYGLLFTIAAFHTSSEQVTAQETGQAFSFYSAVALTLTLAIMLVAAAALRNYFGEAGILAGAGLAGFIDPHSTAISIASLSTSGVLQSNEAAAPILIAMTSNSFAKGLMAFTAGGLGYALRIIPGLVLTIAASWIAAILSIPQLIAFS